MMHTDAGHLDAPAVEPVQAPSAHDEDEPARQRGRLRQPRSEWYVPRAILIGAAGRVSPLAYRVAIAIFRHTSPSCTGRPIPTLRIDLPKQYETLPSGELRDIEAHEIWKPICTHAERMSPEQLARKYAGHAGISTQ